MKKLYFASFNYLGRFGSFKFESTPELALDLARQIAIDGVYENLNPLNKPSTEDVIIIALNPL